MVILFEMKRGSIRSGVSSHSVFFAVSVFVATGGLARAVISAIVRYFLRYRVCMSLFLVLRVNAWLYLT